MKNLLTIISMFVLLSAGCSQQNISGIKSITSPAPAKYDYSHKLLVGNKSLMVEVSSTPAEMEQGLSDRAVMDINQGMLFDFGLAPSKVAFWMKDMKFDLDFIWIKNNRIIFITENAQAPRPSLENLPLYYPPEPVDQVLEVNSGWTEKNNISVGDAVHLEN